MTQAERTTDPTPEISTDRQRRLRLVLAGVLVLLLVGSLAWLALGIFNRVNGDEGPQADRDAVMLRSQEYVLAAATVGPDDLDDKGELTTYSKRVFPLISTARKPVFEKGLTSLSEQITVSGYRSTTKVNRVGVESLSEDSAVALVDLEQSLATKDESLGTMAGQWRVKLVKVDGVWLVDSVTDVVAGSAK
ncbi:MAG TPA: hypothetical protein VIR30_06225 [Nocardioides sp.]